MITGMGLWQIKGFVGGVRAPVRIYRFLSIVKDLAVFKWLVIKYTQQPLNNCEHFQRCSNENNGL